MEWTNMVHYQQQIQKVIHSLLPVRKHVLTASECELLAHLYLQPEENTPILLGKKAVSRCLKSFYEKNCIRKQRQTTDERSYKLFITKTGLEELRKGYESILQPFYDLWRSSGKDFEAFMYYADKLTAHIFQYCIGDSLIALAAVLPPVFLIPLHFAAFFAVLYMTTQRPEMGNVGLYSFAYIYLTGNPVAAAHGASGHSVQPDRDYLLCCSSHWRSRSRAWVWVVERIFGKARIRRRCPKIGRFMASSSLARSSARSRWRFS